jgi:hypothetical protein
MNSTKFVIHNGTVTFSLDNQWMATMIAKKHKGDFDTYFCVIDNFVKHTKFKRIHQTCCDRCYAAKWIIVSRTRSSWVVAFGELPGTIEAACGIYEARWEHYPKQCQTSQGKEDTLDEWGSGAIQSATWRGASGLTVKWRTEIRDWIQK